jgi:hypothetical protein
MDRLHGASEAVNFIRSLMWDLPANSFDSVFKQDDS